MECCGWIKPKVYPMLTICFSIDINVGLQNPWLTGNISKEFKIYLIPISGCRSSMGAHLQSMETIEVDGSKLVIQMSEAHQSVKVFENTKNLIKIV